MDEIKEGVLIALRAGCSVTSVREELFKIINELQSMEVYVKAMKESVFHP